MVLRFKKVFFVYILVFVILFYVMGLVVVFDFDYLQFYCDFGLFEYIEVMIIDFGRDNIFFVDGIIIKFQLYGLYGMLCNYYENVLVDFGWILKEIVVVVQMCKMGMFDQFFFNVVFCGLDILVFQVIIVDFGIVWELLILVVQGLNSCSQ